MRPPTLWHEITPYFLAVHSLISMSAFSGVLVHFLPVVSLPYCPHNSPQPLLPWVCRSMYAKASTAIDHHAVFCISTFRHRQDRSFAVQQYIVLAGHRTVSQPRYISSKEQQRGSNDPFILSYRPHPSNPRLDKRTVQCGWCIAERKTKHSGIIQQNNKPMKRRALFDTCVCETSVRGLGGGFGINIALQGRESTEKAIVVV